MNELAKEFIGSGSFRLEAAGRQWGILEDGIHHQINFDQRSVGDLFVSEDVSKENVDLFIHHAAALVHAGEEKIDEMLKVLAWLRMVKAFAPDKFNWIGVYYKSSYLLGENSTDLVLGPFLGEPTDHTRIPIDRGLCGLALREERVINQADVHADSRHIACSLKTKSELIVPLPTKNEGGFIAELDIDSHQISAFSPEIEAKIKELCSSFPL